MSRPTRTPRLLALVAVLGLGMVALGCSKDDSSSSSSSGDKASTSSAAKASAGPVTVRLGYFPNITHAPALVGIHEGLFAKRLGNNKLEVQSYNAGPAAVEALFGDAVDITYIGPNPSINAFQKSQGDAVRIVSGSTSGGASLVVAKDINSAKDLKGKTVSSPQLGNTQDVALRTWLKDQGLQTDTSGGGDVSIKPQENADTLTAFKTGAIAGAWVPEPWATRLVQEGGGKVLVDEATLWPKGQFVTTNILVSKKFLDAHPEAVKQVLEGHLDALDAITADPAKAKADANAEIEKATQKKLPDAVIDAAWPKLAFTYDPLAATLQKSASNAKAVGLLPSDDVKGIYDLDQLDAVLKERNQQPVTGL
jgi:NitT/TauT family transport system substrate-binding protein